MTQTDIYETIENPETTTTMFYLDKTISYGDFICVIFLLGVILLVIFKAISSFFIPTKIKISK